MAISTTKRLKVLERDEYTCQFCGRHAPNVELQVDHKIPRAMGGKDWISNLQTLCVECNQAKSAGIYGVGDHKIKLFIELMLEFKKEIKTEILEELKNNHQYEKTSQHNTHSTKDDIIDSTNNEDELIMRATEICYKLGRGSASLLQRKLKIGYARAARIIDRLEEQGILSPQIASEPRKVIRPSANSSSPSNLEEIFIPHYKEKI